MQIDATRPCHKARSSYDRYSIPPCLPAILPVRIPEIIPRPCPFLPHKSQEEQDPEKHHPFCPCHVGRRCVKLGAVEVMGIASIAIVLLSAVGYGKRIHA